VEKIRSIPLLRLALTIITGAAAGLFFIGIVILVIHLIGLVAGNGG
jgi:hypothetical protein